MKAREYEYSFIIFDETKPYNILKYDKYTKYRILYSWKVLSYGYFLNNLFRKYEPLKKKIQIWEHKLT